MLSWMLAACPGSGMAADYKTRVVEQLKSRLEEINAYKGPVTGYELVLSVKNRPGEETWVVTLGESAEGYRIRSYGPLREEATQHVFVTNVSPLPGGPSYVPRPGEVIALMAAAHDRNFHRRIIGMKDFIGALDDFVRLKKTNFIVFTIYDPKNRSSADPRELFVRDIRLIKGDQRTLR